MFAPAMRKAPSLRKDHAGFGVETDADQPVVGKHWPGRKLRKGHTEVAQVRSGRMRVVQRRLGRMAVGGLEVHYMDW